MMPVADPHSVYGSLSMAEVSLRSYMNEIGLVDALAFQHLLSALQNIRSEFKVMTMAESR